MVKVYAVYRNGVVPKEIISVFKLNLNSLPSAPVVKVRARMVGERLLPLLSPKVFDLLDLEIKPTEIEVVVCDME